MVRHDARESIAGGLQYDNEFWRFSLAVYERNEVAQECLALQDALGIDINLLLFCAWVGAQGIVLSSENIETASKAVAAWHETVVRPLRGVRRQIKALKSGELEDFRTHVKNIELEAEQIEQAILYAYSKSNPGSRTNTDRHDVIMQNVKKYIELKSSSARGHSPERSAPHLVGAALRLRSRFRYRCARA